MTPGSEEEGVSRKADTTEPSVPPLSGLEQLGNDGPACTIDGICDSLPETPYSSGDKAP